MLHWTRVLDYVLVVFPYSTIIKIWQICDLYAAAFIFTFMEQAPHILQTILPPAFTVTALYRKRKLSFSFNVMLREVETCSCG